MRIILGLLGAFLLTTPAQAEKVFHKSVGTYDIACFNRDVEAYCSSLSHYESLTLQVIISYLKDDGGIYLSMRLSSDDWKIVDRRKYKVKFAFSNGDWWHQKCLGMKMDDTVAVSCLGEFNTKIWDRLIADRWIQFWINGKPAGRRLSLRGSARGFGMQMKAFGGMLKGKPRETFDKEEFRNDLKEF